ncbi:YeeE/YedE family protein [Methylicorpusculum sp.]|uniref:YeeE/YedE family protein n=1 Tax=Methylicorpusculum sp. TaxID=2713644 RepID=UPI00273255A9|nr:YeeE/YedE family protein [Methylicorpusculum sp.]MDP3528580.1 YeeE/YedE family protein [Methylicorpusculum sp.]MDZ4153406.1 YeeE/YedE family protein [Methylicorpusculum sp.]
MSHFTPYPALFGGALIGLSAALLLYLNQRTAGISGIAAGLLSFTKNDYGWRVCFIAGLILAPLLYRLAGGASEVELGTSHAQLLFAGLLVGYGTRMSGGCTSGHAVCGLARGALRSLVATVIFMLTAGVTVYMVRHLL